MKARPAKWGLRWKNEPLSAQEVNSSIMEKKTLIIHIPVVHRGFLDFLEKEKDNIGAIYILREDLQKDLSGFNPDIAAIDCTRSLKILNALGFNNSFVVSAENIEEVKGKKIVLVNDEISRNLYEKSLKGEDIEWKSVFLRWDKSSVVAENPPEGINSSDDPANLEMIAQAYQEAKKTGDWWRQIGAVLVRDKEILIRAYNKDLPTDYTPYQVGEVRDFFKAGERHELASTIHAEEKIVAEAARRGIVLEGASLYVTTFPCPVCAKLIACSGIKNLYFSEGGSSFDAQKVLEAAGVKIVRVLRS